ncbi:unnamed protein product [Closterium sp. NIES-65]|nr:unnamed protein product [Closterium sp. NIES-65]
MPTLASCARSTPYTRLPLSSRLHSAARRPSFGPPHSFARAHCCVGIHPPPLSSTRLAVPTSLWRRRPGLPTSTALLAVLRQVPVFFLLAPSLAAPLWRTRPAVVPPPSLPGPLLPVRCAAALHWWPPALLLRPLLRPVSPPWAPICLWSSRLILPPIPARLLPLQRLPAAATPISPLSPSVMRPGIPSTPVSALLLSFWRVDPLRPSRAPLPLSPRLALPLILGHPLLLKRVLGALLFPTAGLAAVRSLRLARASVLVRLCVLANGRGRHGAVLAPLGSGTSLPRGEIRLSRRFRGIALAATRLSLRLCHGPHCLLPRPSLLPLGGHGLRELDLRGRLAYVAIALPIALARMTARFAAVLPRNG